MFVHNDRQTLDCKTAKTRRCRVNDSGRRTPANTPSTVSRPVPLVVRVSRLRVLGHKHVPLSGSLAGLVGSPNMQAKTDGGFLAIEIGSGPASHRPYFK